MKRFCVLGGLAIAIVAVGQFLVGCGPAAGPMGAAPTSEKTTTALTKPANAMNFQTIPVYGFVFNDCASPAENVALNGTAQISQRLAVDAHGGTHLVLHVIYKNVTGVGQTSGLKYHLLTQDNAAENVSPELLNTGNGQGEATIVEHLRLVAPGPGNDMVVTAKIHITINANGVITVDSENYGDETCK